MDDIAQVVAAAAASADLLPVGVIVLAPDGTCAYAGGRWCELTGLSPDTCDGWGWMCATSPEHRSEVLAWLDDAGSRADLPLEYQSTSEDGVVRWARGWLRPIVGDGGAVLAYVGTIQDATGDASQLITLGVGAAASRSTGTAGRRTPPAPRPG